MGPRDDLAGVIVKSLVVAALATVLVGAAPVAAQVSRVPTVGMSGAQFFNHCATAQNFNREAQAAACVTYVMGVSDGLQAAGLSCTGTRVSPQRLYAVSMWWIRNHWQASRNPAVVMISHGFESVYPCRSVNARVTNPAMEQAVRTFENVAMTEFVKACIAALLG